MRSATKSAALRHQIQTALAERIPLALTPSVKAEPECMACGIPALDDCLRGGLRLGAITELVGAECSGRTTMALAYAAASVQRGNVAAWVDVDDVFDPESAARSGVDAARLLWVRCGQAPGNAAEKADTVSASSHSTSTHTSGQPVPPGGGGSPHPRSEGRGMPQAISDLLLTQPRSSALPLRRRDKSIGTPGAPNRPLPRQAFDREEQVPTDRLPPRRGAHLASVVSATQRTEKESRKEGATHALLLTQPLPVALPYKASHGTKRSWTRLDQALRATDLLLQSGGFSLIVLDLGSTPAEQSWRIPLTTWFRFRAASEHTRTSLLLLTQHPCARSSAELVVRMGPGRMEAQNNVFTEVAFRSEVEKQRFQRPASNVVSIRKPPQSERPGAWKAQAAWAI